MRRLAAVAYITLCAGCDTGPDLRPAPEQEARIYLGQLGLTAEIVGVSCAGTDSDCDGYVTCTAALRSGADLPTHLESLQCAASGSTAGNSFACNRTIPWTEGCKPTRAVAAP